MKKEAFFDKTVVLQHEQADMRHKCGFATTGNQNIKSMRNFAADVQADTAAPFSRRS